MKINGKTSFSFLCQAAFHAEPVQGRPQLTDCSGNIHTGISRYPVIITKAKPARIKRLLTEVRSRKDVLVVDYPHPMLTTGHDDELEAAMRLLCEENLTYYGVILYGDSEIIDRLTKKFSLWR